MDLSFYLPGGLLSKNLQGALASKSGLFFLGRSLFSLDLIGRRIESCRESYDQRGRFAQFLFGGVLAKQLIGV
jgi:hypothetical protein|tara:strand:+ start:1303 stop:1521 length:219 start_codon:yes stop_codon:yes gene_type:complete